MKLRFNKTILVLGIILTMVANTFGSFTTNTIPFTYTNRTALLADGWDFLARTPAGASRNTEFTNGTSPPDVAYARTNGSLGVVLRIPTDSGDMWSSANNTRNSLFRDLSPDWSSVRLQLAFAPTQAFQQAQLMLYQDDDNYVEVGSVYAFPTNPIVGFVREINGGPLLVSSAAIAATNVYLRLDRDVTYGIISAFYSLDGTNWVSTGQTDQDLVNPRLGIWLGGSLGGFPDADLHHLQIVTRDTPVTTSLVFQRPTFVFNSVEGQPCTNIQRVMVVRKGPVALNWTLTNTASWLTASSTNGNTPAAFDLSVNTTGLTPGVYETALQFGVPGAANDPATLTVKLIVNPDVRARASVWRDGKKSALSVWVDDGNTTMFNILNTNGFDGTYVLNGTNVPSIFNTYSAAGMELGAHLVNHNCFLMDEPTLRGEIEPNISGLCATTVQPCEQVISFAFPCGISSIEEQAVTADYFLAARGDNVNRLEDASPYNFMFVNCFNSHENDPAVYNPSAPANPADLKTVVDAAITEGKWANLVFHGLNNDDGAVAYAVGKDIWVATSGSVTKYILQRDRTVISNYVESVGLIQFDCYRLPLDSSTVRSFETAITTNDPVTLQVDITGVPAVSNLTVNGVSTTNYTVRTVASKDILFLDTLMTGSPKTVALVVSTVTNYPPVLATNANVAINEGQTLTITNSATDPNTNSLVFTLGVNAPSGMTITTNGVINWIPGETTGGSNFTVTVIVTDNGLPALSASNSFTVSVSELNIAPILPSQSNRTLIGQTPLTVINTASDADILVNPLVYSLLEGPTNAVINASGVITWTPGAAEFPSTNIFTTVVTDTNALAVNTQMLSATNSFTVTVLASPLSLPVQTNHTINELTTLIATNTGTDVEILESGNVGYLITNTFNFTYTNRSALLADGWDFIARTTNGSPRNTEQTNGAVVSYDQDIHPGALRIPIDVGDLWQFVNDTRNSLFRDLSSNWMSMTLNLSLSLTQNFQQAHLALYQDDDNWVHAGIAYNNTFSGTQIAPIVRELNGVPNAQHADVSSVTNIHLRLTRNIANSDVTVIFSLDGGTNWVTVGTTSQSLVNPRLAIWTGGSPGGFPDADLHRVDVVTTNAPKHLTYVLLNPPAGAVVNSTNGVITWTPNETQGPGTNVITTVVTDNGVPPLYATNSFTVVVNEVNSAPNLTFPGITNILSMVAWSAMVTETDADIPTNSFSFALLSGPLGLTMETNGLISWTPSQAQADSTNTVLVSVTDTNPAAVNSTSLSVTSSFQIVAGPVLTVTANNTNRMYGDANPAFTGTLSGLRAGDDITATYLTTATTNSAAGTYAIIPVLHNPPGASSNLFNFTYTNRQALVSDGWSFIARTSGGLPRNTEITNGAVISYDQIGHPGVLQIPCDVGDLWAGANNSRNSLFRDLSSNWVSVRLEASLAPTTMDFQQFHLAVYQNDDNYVQVGLAYSGGVNDATLDLEVGGAPVSFTPQPVAATNIHVRMDRNPSNGLVTGLYSLDGTNWTTISQIAQVLVNPQLGIWVGGSPVAYTNGLPDCDLRRLDIVVTNPAAAGTLTLYTIITNTGTLTIAPRPVTVTAFAQSKVFGQSDPPLTHQITSGTFVNSDTLAGALSRVSGENAGVYPIQQGTLAATENYALTYVGANLTITKSNAPVSLGNLSHVFDGSAKSANAITVPSGLIVNFTYNGSANAPTNVGSYEVIGTVVEVNYAGSATNTLVIQNSAPAFVTTPSDATLPEQTTLTVTNGASDGDLPANTLSYTLVNAPGNAVIDGAGVITWTPGESEGPGTNILTSVVSDGLVSVTNSFTVIVTEVNVAPVAANDSYSITNSVLMVAAGGLLINDSDDDLPANVLTVILVSGPTNGVLNFSSNGGFTYIPNSGFNGLDVFTYHAFDGVTNSTVATVSISVSNRLFVITSVEVNAGVAVVTWNSVIGLSYRVQYKDILTAPLWTDVNPVVTATSISTSVTNSIGSAPQRFYRVQIVEMLQLNIPTQPIILSLQVTNGNAIITWSSVPGNIYGLQYKTNMTDPEWTNVLPTITATAGTITTTNFVGGSSQRFYRVYRSP